MRKSFISLVITCIFTLFVSVMAQGQSVVAENTTPEVVEHSEEAFSGLTVIPNSYDYGAWYCTHSVTYGFQIKNNGSTSQSGSVFINGGLPFSCVSGCSFNLSPSQSQIAYIKFAPFYEGSANGTLIAGSGATASLSGEGVELDPDDPNYPLCD